MPLVKYQRHYLREWRESKGLTQAQVCDRLAVFDDPKLPKTEATLSRVEICAQIYTERLLNALADIYETTVAELVGRNPFKEGEIVDLLDRMDPATRDIAIAVVTSLAENRQPYTPPPAEPPPLTARRKARRKRG
jgi:transcriptional regulator with XRE-family HTH domain